MAVGIEGLLSEQSLARAWDAFGRYSWSVGLNDDNLRLTSLEVEKQAGALLNQIRLKQYQALPMRWQRVKPTSRNRKEYPKRVFDCVIQQALVNELAPIAAAVGLGAPEDPRGRRDDPAPKLEAVRGELRLGRRWVCELRTTFCLSERSRTRFVRSMNDTLGDKVLTSLVAKYLLATSRDALPDSARNVFCGPLYNLLFDLCLVRLDEELSQCGLPWLRDGGTCWVFCESEAKAEAAERLVRDAMAQKLFFDEGSFDLRVAPAEQVSFLGFAVDASGEALRVHPDEWSDFKCEVKRITSRSYGQISNEARASMFSGYVSRWARQHRLAEFGDDLAEIDEWAATRIRMDIWKQWKMIGTRIERLMELGVPRGAALKMANSRMGPWPSAQNPILRRALTRKVLSERYGFLLPASAVRREQEAVDERRQTPDERELPAEAKRQEDQQ